ncbi:MAG: hypothetical protein ACYTE8_00960 [Planctomycetota bacterium]
MKINYRRREDYCPYCELELPVRSIDGLVRNQLPRIVKTQCHNCNAIIEFNVRYVEARLERVSPTTNSETIAI